MKTTLEPEDIQAIASAVLEALRPLLSANGKHHAEETIFTPKTLAKYLGVPLSWVYKQTFLKTIPFSKTGKYIRFKRTDIDKWIETQTIRPFPPLKIVKSTR